MLFPIQGGGDDQQAVAVIEDKERLLPPALPLDEARIGIPDLSVQLPGQPRGAEGQSGRGEEIAVGGDGPHQRLQAS